MDWCFPSFFDDVANVGDRLDGRWQDNYLVDAVFLRHPKSYLDEAQAAFYASARLISTGSIERMADLHVVIGQSQSEARLGQSEIVPVPHQSSWSASHAPPCALRKRQARVIAQQRISRHGVDPYGYFEWAFEMLMHNLPAEDHGDLLPVNWIKTRPAASRLIETPAASKQEMQDIPFGSVPAVSHFSLLVGEPLEINRSGVDRGNRTFSAWNLN